MLDSEVAVYNRGRDGSSDALVGYNVLVHWKSNAHEFTGCQLHGQSYRQRGYDEFESAVSRRWL